MTFKERLKKARQLVKESEKKGGRLMFAKDLPDLEFLPTGIEALDQLTGRYYGEAGKEEYSGHGGIPMGRYTIIWGPEAVGKSTLVYRILGNAQKAEKLCLLIDAENRASAPWLVQQGVDLDTLLWHRGGIMEEGLQDVLDLMELVDFIVVDTVHALAPKAELHGGGPAKKERTMMDDAPMGRQAFALSKFFRRATHKVSMTNTGIVLVGQARDRSVMQKTIKDLVGGNALRHYVTIRLDVSKITDKQKVPKKKVAGPDGSIAEVPVGFIQKIKLGKAGTNHREGQIVQIPFLYGVGPDDFESNIMAAVAMGVIQNPTAGRYEVPVKEGDPKKIHGRESLLEFFRANMEFYDWVMNCITQEYKDGQEEDSSGDEEDAR